MIPVPLEKDIQRAILQYLALRGILAWRVNSGAVSGTYKGKQRFVRFNGAEGCSDIIGMIPGRLFDPPRVGATFLAVEVKRPNQKPTEKQQRFLDMVSDAGAISFVARSVADVERALEAEGCVR